MDRSPRLRILGILAVIAISGSASILAQSVDPTIGLIRVAPVATAGPRAYGTVAQTLYQVPASGCSPIASTTLNADVNGYFYSIAGPGVVDCPLNLPAGALIDHFQVLVYDANDTINVIASLGACTTINVGSGCTGYGDIASSGTAAAPFNGYLTSDVSGFGLAVDKESNLYYVRVVLQQPDNSVRFRQVNVFYRQQVSPPPAVATFADVPTSSPQFRFIEALHAAGITAGCGGGNFCPNAPITRGQMAVFLSVALGLHFPN